MGQISAAPANRDDVLRHLRSLEPQLQARGLRSLHLFGSMARDEAGVNSDIDLFAEFVPDAPLGWDFAGTPDFLTNELGHPVDLTTRRALHPLLKADIEREAIKVF